MKLTNIRRLILALVACVPLILVGCIPQALIVWAPNGESAVLIVEGGVRLCDGEGNLSEPLLLGKGVGSVEWFPDSKRFFAVVVNRLRTWKEIEPLLSQKRKGQLITLAEAFRDELLSHDGDPGLLDTAIDKKGNELFVMMIYLRDNHSDGLAEKLGGDWKKFEKAEVQAFKLQICEVTSEGPKAGPVLLKSIDWIVTPRISPDGKVIAYTQGKLGKLEELAETELGLFVLPTDGTATARLVDAPVVRFPDWSTDGKSLVYAIAHFSEGGGEGLALGEIRQRQVRNDEGSLLEKFSEPKSVAGVLFDQFGTRIRCLRDGRILFSAYEIHLPTTGADMPSGPSLFAVDPTKQATVIRILPRGAEVQVADMVNLFEVSPDETKVAIVGAEGQVTVLTLATGQVLTVQPDKESKRKHKTSYIRTIPKWRSANELCFAVPPGSKYGSPNRAEVVLWSPEGYRCISKDWPDSATPIFKNN